MVVDIDASCFFEKVRHHFYDNIFFCGPLNLIQIYVIFYLFFCYWRIITWRLQKICKNVFNFTSLCYF